MAFALGMVGINFARIPRNYRIDWFMRDPFDRAVSCFINRFVVYNGERVTPQLLARKPNDVAIRFLEIGNTSLSRITFRKFIEIIARALQRSRTLDHHFAPQVNLRAYRCIHQHVGLTVHNIDKTLQQYFHANSSPYCARVPEGFDLTRTVACHMPLKRIHRDAFESARNLVYKTYALDTALFRHITAMKVFDRLPTPETLLRKACAAKRHGARSPKPVATAKKRANGAVRRA